MCLPRNGSLPNYRLHGTDDRCNHQGQGDNPWVQQAVQTWQGLLRNGKRQSTKNLSQLWNTNESVKFFSNRLRILVLDRP